MKLLHPETDQPCAWLRIAQSNGSSTPGWAKHRHIMCHKRTFNYKHWGWNVGRTAQKAHGPPLLLLQWLLLKNSSGGGGGGGACTCASWLFSEPQKKSQETPIHILGEQAGQKQRPQVLPLMYSFSAPPAIDGQGLWDPNSYLKMWRTPLTFSWSV